jgi:hypothetical protein
MIEMIEPERDQVNKGLDSKVSTLLSSGDINEL